MARTTTGLKEPHRQRRRRMAIDHVTLISLFSLAAAASLQPALAAGTASVTGAIAWPDPAVADPASLELRLTPLDGDDSSSSSSPKLLTTWPRAASAADGAGGAGLFTFHGVPRGRSFSLDVSSPALVFPRVLVEVKEENEQEGGEDSAPFRAWLVAPLADVAASVVGPGNGNGGGGGFGGGGGTVTAPRDPTATSTAVPLPLERMKTKGKTSVPLLVLRPTARTTFFETPQPFNLVAFLKTPYGMLIGFVAFAVFALPRMKIDPEEYEELLGGGGGGGGGNNAAVASPPRLSPRQQQLPAGSPSGLRQRRG